MTQTKHFSIRELQCSHCGKTNPNPEFITLMDKVEKLRESYGKPLKVSSGYRCPKHKLEASKKALGQHTIAAIDLKVHRKDAHKILELAFALGFHGIGVQQKGDTESRFIHLDIRPSKTVWSY